MAMNLIFCASIAWIFGSCRAHPLGTDIINDRCMEFCRAQNRIPLSLYGKAAGLCVCNPETKITDLFADSGNNWSLLDINDNKRYIRGLTDNEDDAKSQFLARIKEKMQSFAEDASSRNGLNFDKDAIVEKIREKFAKPIKEITPEPVLGEINPIIRNYNKNIGIGGFGAPTPIINGPFIPRNNNYKEPLLYSSPITHDKPILTALRNNVDNLLHKLDHHPPSILDSLSNTDGKIKQINLNMRMDQTPPQTFLSQLFPWLGEGTGKWPGIVAAKTPQLVNTTEEIEHKVENAPIESRSGVLTTEEYTLTEPPKLNNEETNIGMQTTDDASEEAVSEFAVPKGIIVQPKEFQDNDVSEEV